MSDATLTDPVFGPLTPFDQRHWNATVGVTPKHPVRVTIVVATFTPNQGMAERLPQARQQYEAIRQAEWHNRLATARYLVEYFPDRVTPGEGAEALARRLRLTGLLLWDNGVSHAFYRLGAGGPEVQATIDTSGSFSHASVQGDD